MEAVEQNNLWVMGEKEIFHQAIAILKSQKAEAKSWNYDQHAELIANIAVEHGLPVTMKGKFKTALKIQGAGVAGNSSQFRQWLGKQGVAIKKGKRNSAIAELLEGLVD